MTDRTHPLYEPNPVRQSLQNGQIPNEGTVAEQIDNLGLFEDKQDPAQEQPEPPKAEQEEETQNPAEQEEDQDSTEEDQKTEETPSDKEEQAETQSEEDETPIESVHQLAEALEVTSEDLDSLQYTFKANGEDVTVQLGELRSGYQRQADYTRKAQELAQQRKDLQNQLTERTQQLEREAVQLGQMLTEAKRMMVGDLNNAEMQQLRATNPAEYSARAIDLQNRVNQVDQLYNLASQQYQKYQDDQGAAQQAEYEKRKAEELDKLRTALPDWGDQLRGDIVKYLNSSYGFTDQDLANVMDARLIQMANKARLYDQGQQVSKQVKKKVKTLPKVVKGKKSPPKTSVAQMNRAKAMKRLKSTGNTRDAAELIGFLNLD